jgi:hypothetical protein
MNTLRPYELVPLDTLFFRDARPMQAGAGSGGHGAKWPLPTVVHEALRASLLGCVGAALKPGEARGHFRHGRRPFIVTEEFRGLRIRGPFPVKEEDARDTFYLPWPKDLAFDAADKEDASCRRLVRLAPLASANGSSDLPQWLRPAAASSRTGKDTPPDWISMERFVSALSLGVPSPLPGGGPLFDSEHRIGIEIDDDKGSVKEGQFYSAEHLRLRPGVRLWFGASIEGNAQENHDMSDLGALLGETVTLGGESRQCRLLAGSDLPAIPTPPNGSQRIKWVLATHAVFNGGWRPNWISADDGRVLLKKGDLCRPAGSDRKSWRTRVRGLPDIRARLVSAVVSKPIFFSGWDASLPNGEGNPAGGPKPTLLAAPAGSVYFFQAESPEDGDALVRALHGRNQSDFLGEKGMGLGYCGVWDYVPDVR